MKVYSRISDIVQLQLPQQRFAVTIGNFDGVHMGHRKLIKEILDECRKLNLELILITFKPHPQQILCPGSERFLINSYTKRSQLLAELGVAHIVEFEFTRDFSTLRPDEFLSKFVFEDFVSKHKFKNNHIQRFYVGHDFAFGANKQGDHEVIQRYCSDRGIPVVIEKEHKLSDSIVCSSRVRSLIREGDVRQARQLLERPFFVEGHVIKGDGRGRKIGFPTANIVPDSFQILPKNAVYITQTLLGKMLYNSITNVGVKPTFGSTSPICVETNIFDFESDIYGNLVEVKFLDILREEKKFDSVNQLIAQIEADVHKAQDYFRC